MDKIDKDIETVIQALSGAFIGESLSKNEELLQKLTTIKEEDEKNFRQMLEFAQHDFYTVVEAAYGISGKNSHILRYILSGTFEEFHQKRIQKLEGSACCADKSSFITSMTLKALKTNQNLSLFADYQDVPQIKEDKEKQAYWSPKTVPDTDTAIKLFVDWYNVELTENKKERSATDTIKTLYDAMKKAKAGNVHFVLHAPFHDPNVAATISVYDNEKPAHLVLEELESWLEKNGQQAVLDKIKELAVDMSFLQTGNLQVKE